MALKNIRHIISLLIFNIWILSLNAHGQKNMLDVEQKVFDTAIEFYENEEYDSAVIVFKSFLEYFPKSNLTPRAHFNLGVVYFDKHEYNLAIPVFKDILNADYDEKEYYGGLMEQYTLYKHRSAINLAEIYLLLNDFKAAERYIKLFDKKYEYKHFCGNEKMSSEIYTACTYARLYKGKGNLDRAIGILLPYTFSNGLASNEGLQNLLIDLLEEKYTIEELQEFAIEAIESLEIKDTDTGYLRFINTKIKVDSYALYDFKNPDYRENLKLTGNDIIQKVVVTNPVFKKYLVNSSP